MTVDVGAWLRGLGLGQYEPAFRDNDVGADLLPTLTADDLRELGVSSLGHRKRLLAAIAALGPPVSLEPSVAPPAPSTLPTSTESQAERRQLTVMFVDLVGSTELSRRLDPEEMRDIIRAYQDAVAGAVARFEGHVAKFMGDGVLAYFGWPRAHEDEAERAVLAALAVVGAVGQLGPRAGALLACRVGIATGLVVVGDLIGEGAAREQAVVGETPNLAARLQGVAGPGRVLVAGTTRRLLGGLFALEPLAVGPLKGFGGEVEAFRVLGEDRVEDRFEALRGTDRAPLVGRDHELALLLDRWERAREGEGQVVMLCGEPGIGKSRLVSALRHRLRDEPHTVLRYQASPHHPNSALWPVAEQLERAAGIEREDPPAANLDRLEALLREAAPEVAASAPILTELLGLPDLGRYSTREPSPQQRKSETFGALLAQLDGLAARRPVLIVLEDAHWLDPTSRELFDMVVGRVQRLRALLVVTFRPELAPPWEGHPHATLLTLGRLGTRQVLAIAERVARGWRLPDEVLGRILAKSEGVPLFVEELTKTVLEAGLLDDVGDGPAPAGPSSALEVPATLQDSLMARLDRMAPVKEVAQTAAAIGREFGYALLAAVSTLPPPELGRALDQLVAGELLFVRGTPPEASYAFKHALLRDAAYESLLKSSRARLHGRIAAALQERRSLGSEPEVLAHHLTLAERYEAATDYWLQAGVRASDRSAYVEAANSLANGLLTVARVGDPRTRLEMELRIRGLLVSALRATKGHAAAELEDTLRRSLHLATELDNPVEVSHALNGLSLVHVNRGDLQQARMHAEEALRRADLGGDRPCQILAHRTMGTALLLAGEFASARRELERTVELYRPEQDRTLLQRYAFDPLVAALGFLEWICWILGYPDTARRHLRRSGEHAERLGHGYSVIYHHTTAALLHLMLRDPASTRTHAGTVIELSEEQRLPYFASIAKCCDGWARATAGDGEVGMARIREGLAARQAVPWEPFMLACMADALLTAGRGDEAMTRLAEAADLVERTGSRWWEVELHRLQGLCWLTRPTPDADQAEAGLRRALDVARSQGARSWELRAAISLARLWGEQGKPAQARELLAPLHACFTEGLDTRDLQDARTLLDELQ
ncbi:AAA family ATPase [Geminicoccus roseus]|uniref:AAA family ATPase n=1 Tax=Geminicoccus roseus TaxID=404900 RepID=UPI000558ACA8|nr:AAA family ATPase [Geminicoccus roseus]